MYIGIENELGKINLNSGVFRVMKIAGLGLCEKNVSVTSYDGVDGQEVVSSYVPSRDITISGDIMKHKRGTQDIVRLIKILNRPCVLKIQNRSMKRKITVRCSVFSAEPQDANAVFQPYVIQLTADNPFFEDFTEQKVPLYLKEDLIEGSFTLPCVFSKRLSRINIPVTGDENVRPKVFILCESEGDGEDYGIEIINHTENKRFKLTYRMKQGEEICIDFEKRTIESNMKDLREEAKNLLLYMSSDSFLSDFYFISGLNDIETVSLDANCQISSYTVFSNKYAEAVI